MLDSDGVLQGTSGNVMASKGLKGKLIVLLLCAMSTIAYVMYSSLRHGIKSAYVEWGVLEMIIDYCEDHEKATPNSMDDLRPYFRQEGNLMAVRSFDDLQGFVLVDFEAVGSLPDDDEFNARKYCFKRNWNTVTIHVVPAEWILFKFLKNDDRNEIDRWLRKREKKTKIILGRRSIRSVLQELTSTMTRLQTKLRERNA